jgi:hypothetical protein
MKSKEYIKEVIDNHEKIHGGFDPLEFSELIRDEIEMNINNGIYAFQIIYNKNGQAELIKNLDYRLCIHENILGRNHKFGDGGNGICYNKMWSYDGGQRYQWSEIETLIFDPSVIRNIKIESIL